MRSAKGSIARSGIALNRLGRLAAIVIALGACAEGGIGAKEREPMNGEHAYTNRLIHERSPYLLQHAHNRVDWYPWGPEALEKARTEQKPIFLSIGYSTCHWCHVMERESFENPEIAELLNRHFVSIKVDREERPDLDNLYMMAVQGMTGSGGWPMSVFLTPDLEPFFAGTYFPPQDQYGRPGFGTLLQNIRRAWQDDRPGLAAQGERVAEFLRAQSRKAPAEPDARALTTDLLDSAHRAMAGSYDEERGGFGRAPKFPTPHTLTFLLRYAERTGSGSARAMVRGTLNAMAAGGIHDHLGGGFHRYSTDERWLVPHFEKMLYDQAGLTLAYAAGWLVFGEETYATVVRQIANYVLRDLSHPDGGFYSAEDADSEGEEGTFYVWTAAEIDAVLGPETAPAFRNAYRVADLGNWEGKNILHVGAVAPDLFTGWEDARRRLFEHRSRRPRPHRDEKIIVEWNGYMIEALARAGTALAEPRYVQAAARAARFIETHLWREGRLLRHYRDGAADVPAYLPDHVYLGRGLLALYEATFDPEWLEKSLHLARETIRLFSRPEGGFVLAGIDVEPLLAPVVDTYDGALPSGNSVAAAFLLRLGHLTASDEMRTAGWNVLEAFAQDLQRNPSAHLAMLAALDFGLGPNTEVVVAGDASDPVVKRMWSALWGRYLPNTVTAFRPVSNADLVVSLIPYLELQTTPEGKPTAYVCRDYACRLPVHDTPGLLSRLRENPRDED
jgi:uncharacterized protein YyaL (SSP411 family)